METIRYARIGREDVNFGTGTFEVRLADGRVVILSEIDLGVLLSDATISTRNVTLDSLTVTTLTPTTLNAPATLRIPEKADPGSPASGEIWINSGGTVLEYADDAGTPAAHAVVGADTTQTLTNKTLTAPAISAPVLSGTVTGTYTLGGSPTLGSPLALNGNDLTDIDEIAINDAATNPTAAGRLRRSGNELAWRVSAGSMRLFYGEAGTTMVFWQGAAPTGWTKLTTQHDKVLRVVSGTGGGTGGTLDFSTFAAATGLHTLTNSELPFDLYSAQVGAAAGVIRQTTCSTLFSTGGSAHTHWATQDLKYVDVLLCSKD